MRHRAAAAITLAAALGASPLSAQARLRDLSTDRPDRTESPITVDKGHLQFELDFFNVVEERNAGFRSHTVGLGAINAKVGLRRNIDLQFVGQLYSAYSDNAGGDVLTAETTSLPDLTTRLKINLWGNDGGRTAFALMPFITVPTSNVSPAALEGGLIAPLGIELGGGWAMGVMAEVDVVRGETAPGHHLNFVQTATIGHDITGSLGGYFELASEIQRQPVTRAAFTANGGLTLGVGDNLQFDAGLNVGLNAHAERLRVFVGMARRY